MSLDLIQYEYAVASLENLEVEKSLTSQNADILEDELTALITEKIERFMKENKEKQKQIQDFQLEYGNEIKSMIHVKIESAFREGANYVGRVVGEPSIYISPENSMKIEELTNGTLLFFWRQLDLQIKANEAKARAKETLTDAQLTQYRKANPLLAWYGVEPAAQLIANDAITSSVAHGTRDKALELKPTRYKYSIQHWRIVFVSRRDGKVCVICTALDFRNSHVEWELTSPFIIIPRRETHRRCRCRLMLKIDKKLYPLF